MALDAAGLTAIVDYFKGKYSWDFSPDANREDRHKGFFVRRRAAQLAVDHSPWLSDSELSTLKGRIDSELVEVIAYLSNQVGTRQARGPLFGGAGDLPAPDNHLNLVDVARIKESDPGSTRTVGGILASASDTVDRRVLEYLGRRRMRVQSIVWRATALHKQLWVESVGDGGKTAIILRPAMNEVVDRRLRIAERMNFQIGNHEYLGGDSRLTLTGATGPWLDGFRVRMFEYPRIDVPTDAQKDAIGRSNIAPPGHDPEYDPAYTWRFGKLSGRLEYNKAPYPGIRFTEGVSSDDWTQLPGPGSPDDGGNYRLRMKQAAGPPSAIIDRLFTTSADIWKRNWLFCDHVLCALQLEAMRFGKKRRTHSDAVFDAIAAPPKPDGFVSLDALVSGEETPEEDPDEFMIDPGNLHFDNVAVTIYDLEVGDHALFWNSFVYQLVSSGVWQLENSLVIHVDSDPYSDPDTPIGSAQRARFGQLQLQGHGTWLHTYRGYADGIARHLGRDLKPIWSKIEAAPTPASPLDALATKIWKWAPYESFASPGAWWIEVPLSTGPWGSLADALAAVPKSVSEDLNPGPGYTAAPNTTSAFFPLYEPKINGGWQTYFTLKTASARARVPRALRRVAIDGTILPGFFYGGVAKKFTVLRPKVSP